MVLSVMVSLTMSVLVGVGEGDGASGVDGVGGGVGVGNVVGRPGARYQHHCVRRHHEDKPDSSSLPCPYKLW